MSPEQYASKVCAEFRAVVVAHGNREPGSVDPVEWIRRKLRGRTAAEGFLVGVRLGQATAESDIRHTVGPTAARAAEKSKVRRVARR